MEEERFISGYCRMQDQSRTVLVELSDGQAEADCSYACCPYSDACTVARQIRELTRCGEA